MWIDGRRAFRPDSNYYRSIRRTRLSRVGERGRRASAIGAVVVFAAVVVVGLVWLLLK